ncbi:MAG TPA: 4'-phosphopantetheinyl transferase superfamily protein [Roseiflexaceae bacterium]|nr:4'-phosphopantetheinyl transferase superfamily protein [Roseiflexaceae bacterium]
MTTVSPWSPAPAELALPAGVVHLWRLSAVQPPARIAALRALLSPDEVARADRFYFQRDRDRYTLARGVLRQLLGRYLGARPERLRFGANAYGKPTLDDPPGAPIRFNLSHSGTLILYGFTGGPELGVDVEQIRPEIDLLALAKHSFSAPEQATLRALPPEQHADAFFNCWSRKESYIKARGEGLSRPLDMFDVTLAPDEPARLLATRDEPDAVTQWSLYAFPIADGYKAALTVQGQPSEILYFEGL